MALNGLGVGRGLKKSQRQADRHYDREFGCKKPSEQSEPLSESDASESDGPDSDDDYNPDSCLGIIQEGKSSANAKPSIDSQALNELKLLTKDFTLTYKHIVGRSELQQGALAQLSEELIKYIIRRERQNLQRQQAAKKNQQVQSVASFIGKKRAYCMLGAESDEGASYKRIRSTQEQAQAKSDFTLAATTIKNFEFLDTDFQNKLLSKVSELLTEHPHLLRKALDKQVQQHARSAIELYESKHFTKLTELLDSVSPMAAILLNIKICLSCPNLMEQGNTLSMTLLPYIELCSDFSFLKEDQHFMLNQFLQALTIHIQDTKLDVLQGFMLFALKINPRTLAEIPHTNANSKSLAIALVHSGFSEAASLIMRKHPSKFLWPELLKFFDGKPAIMVDNCVNIIAKLEVLDDPANQMNTLYDLFGQRKLIVDLLLSVESIHLSISQLIIALELLCPMKQESIIEILRLPSTKWLTAAEQVSNKEDAPNKEVMMQKLPELYASYTKGIEEPLPLDDMYSISKEVSQLVDCYRHCEYQSMIAASIVSQKSDFVVATVPTGSGKTWIQALVAKYYCQQGFRVAIIEPTEQLAEQTMERVSTVDYEIRVYTIDNFYQGACNNQILIIDEYDSVLTSAPYAVQNAQIAGVWMLRQSKVIAFSATSFRHIERFVSNCIRVPIILNFKSEYEVCNGVDPIQLGNVFNCASEQEMLKQLDSELAKHYDCKPIVVIHTPEQGESILKVLKANKYTFYKGATLEVLSSIKDQNHGVLLLTKSECRGVDVRFAKDARVVITCKPDDYNQYLQMLGRASRTRGVSEGIMLYPGAEKVSMIMQQLKSANNATMQLLERLVQLLEQKSKEKVLVSKLEQLMKDGKVIRSLKELESELGAAAFAKLSKPAKQ